MTKSKLVSRFIKWGTMIAAVTALITTSLTVHAGDYDSAREYNVIATAMNDARLALRVETGGSGGSSSASSSVVDAESEINKRAGEIITAGNFGNVGIVYGTSDQGKLGILSVLQSPASATTDTIDRIDELTGTTHMRDYHTFGLAMTKLTKQASKMKVTGITSEVTAGEYNKSVMKLSNFGLNLLKKYSPAPVILAFLDSSELNKASNADNQLVSLINGNDNFKEIITFFGEGVTVGSVKISRSLMIVGVMNLMLLAYGAIAKLANGSAMGIQIRRQVVKILAATAGVALGAKLLDSGVKYFTEISNDGYDYTDNIVSKNLNLADWYATSFALPADVTVDIKKGRFIFSEDDVYKINHYTYKQITGADGTDDELADRIIEAATGDNEVSVNFNPAYSNATSGGSDGAGRYWYTDGLYALAESIGSDPTKSLADIDRPGGSSKALAAGYLTYHGLQMTGDSRSATVTSDGKRWGMSPIGAYSLMRTSFDSTGFAVKTNSGTTKFPAIAVNVASTNVAGTEKPETPTIVRLVASFAMTIAAMKAFVEIIMSGIGATLKGAGRSSLGSVEGTGELVGGVIALLGGMFGIGMIMGLTMSVIDAIYSMFSDMMKPSDGSVGVATEMLQPLKDQLSSIPFIGPMLSGLLSGVVGAIVNIVAIFALPKITKIPIETFGQYMTSLPGDFAGRARMMANKFIGDHFMGGGGGFGRGGFGGGSAPGTVGGAIGQSVKDSNTGMAATAGALGAISGYAAGKVGSWMTADNSSSVAGDNEVSEGDTNDTDSVDQATDVETNAEEATELQNQMEESQSQQFDSDGSVTAETESSVAEGDTEESKEVGGNVSEQQSSQEQSVAETTEDSEIKQNTDDKDISNEMSESQSVSNDGDSFENSEDSTKDIAGNTENKSVSDSNANITANESIGGSDNRESSGDTKMSSENIDAGKETTLSTAAVSSSVADNNSTDASSNADNKNSAVNNSTGGKTSNTTGGSVTGGSMSTGDNVSGDNVSISDKDKAGYDAGTRNASDSTRDGVKTDSGVQGRGGSLISRAKAGVSSAGKSVADKGKAVKAGAAKVNRAAQQSRVVQNKATQALGKAMVAGAGATTGRDALAGVSQLAKVGTRLATGSEQKNEMAQRRNGNSAAASGQGTPAQQRQQRVANEINDHDNHVAAQNKRKQDEADDKRRREKSNPGKNAVRETRKPSAQPKSRTPEKKAIKAKPKSAK